MTNYEWLKKHDYMPTFIYLVKTNDMQELTKRYGVPKKYYSYLADWLELERETKKYVSFDEVIDIISHPNVTKVTPIKEKYKLDEIQAMINDSYMDIINRLYELEKEEIED